MITRTRLSRKNKRHLRKHIIGSGGGGGKGGSSGHTPTEDPDTLRSRSNAKILDALGEGEIVGFVNGLKSVFFDGTPLQDIDTGADNFTNYKIFFMPGVQDQNYIPDFTDAANTVNVGIQLKHNTPWVHHITAPELDALLIGVRFPRLQLVNKSNGDIHGTSVRLTIELQTNGGGYVQVINDTVTGKTTNGYVRSYRVALGGEGPWDIRVTRVTDDSAVNSLSNDTYLDTYSEIVEAKLRYPNTALVGCEFDAEKFATIPVRTYHIKGLKIKIPANYDPINRTYATSGPGTSNGAWDGTFKTDWTNNPAWVWYDLLTNERYGMGGLVNSGYIDKFSLYTIAKYCDALVPDGNGGMEPRFCCNVYIQTYSAALQLLQDLAGVFRAMTYYSNGLIVPVQDCPNPTISAQFAPENIIGQFKYTGTALSARQNLFTIAYNDYAQLGQLNYVQVQDEDSILKNGILENKSTAFACYSPGQAWRLGQWMLLTNQLDNDVESHVTGHDAAKLRPGDIYQTQDPSRSGRALSGKIKAATTSIITLDKTVTIEAGKTYEIATFKTDGTIQFKAITNAAGDTNQIHISAPNYDVAPDSSTLWILKVSDLVPELWRCLACVPNASTGNFEVTGSKYNASKFAAVDDTGAIEIPPTSVLPNTALVKAPGAITIIDVPVNTPAGVQRSLHVSWEPSGDQYLRAYQVSYRYEQGNWVVLTDGAVADVTIPNAKVGYYEVQVVTINTLGRKSQPTFGNHYIDGTNPLGQQLVTGLELKGQGNDTIFTTRDAKFAWRINSPTQSQEISNDPLAGNLLDPFFSTYEVTIWNGTDELWHELVQVPEYTYTEERNLQAAQTLYGSQATALNAFRIEVRVLDAFNNLSEAEILNVSNPPPDAPSDASVVATASGAQLQWTNALDVDLSETRILFSTDPFDPSPRIAGRAATPTNSYSFANNYGITDPIYFWLQHADTFGNASITTFVGSTVPGQSAGDVVVTPNGGTISASTPVTAECPTTPTAQIFYRYDGTTPGPTDTLYNPASPPHADATHETITFVAILGSNVGNPVTAVFDFNAGACAAPTFSPLGETVATGTGTQDVVISTVEAGRHLIYTEDNSPPTLINGTVIAASTGTVTLPTGMTTLKAIAVDPAAVLAASSVTSEDYIVTLSGGGGGGPGGGGPGGGGTPAAATPEFTPPAGTFKIGSASSMPIVIVTATQRGNMRNTQDASAPTSGSGGHGTGSGPIVVNNIPSRSTKTEKAIAYLSGLADSGIGSAVFTTTNATDTGAQDPIMVPATNTYAKSDIPVSVATLHDGDGIPFTRYTWQLKLGVATPTPNLTMYWTGDGSTPSPAHGTLINASAGIMLVQFTADRYSGEAAPVMPGTVTVKVIAIRGGGVHSNVVTKTINFT